MIYITLIYEIIYCKWQLYCWVRNSLLIIYNHSIDLYEIMITWVLVSVFYIWLGTQPCVFKTIVAKSDAPLRLLSMFHFYEAVNSASPTPVCYATFSHTPIVSNPLSGSHATHVCVTVQVVSSELHFLHFLSSLLLEKNT